MTEPISESLAEQPAAGDAENNPSVTYRLLWLMKPLGALLLLLWIASPTTADRLDLHAQIAWGFLLGSFYGLFFFREEIARTFSSNCLKDNI
ncbi:MAG: hypothetical protein H6922_05610 [Pseudomonadaceae bacterium]|nr:hypothetical protein [Pseudomonadaceae bacterium]